MSTARRFCFTINNPTTQLAFSPETTPDVRYCVHQLEHAPTTGTPHYQGYIEIKKSVRFHWIQSRIPGFSTSSLKVAVGTAEQNKIYCTKAESRVEGPWEYGQPGQQGKSDALTAVKRQLDEGASMEEVAEENFGVWCKHRNAFQEYKKMKSAKREWKTKVIFLYGPPGTGKSSYIRDNSAEVHWKSQDKWWDGYDGEADVALDDFYGWIPYSVMLRLMDRYPMDVEIKGAKVNFAPKVLYISSNKLPWEWWSQEVPYNQQAFMRRIDEIVYMPTQGEQIHYFPEGSQIPVGNTFPDFIQALGGYTRLI